MEQDDLEAVAAAYLKNSLSIALAAKVSVSHTHASNGKHYYTISFGLSPEFGISGSKGVGHVTDTRAITGGAVEYSAYIGTPWEFDVGYDGAIVKLDDGTLTWTAGPEAGTSEAGQCQAAA